MIPMSQRQMVNLYHCVSPDDIQECLDLFVCVHDGMTESPYYKHIDHLQILPANEDGIHTVFIISHTVYLQHEMATY